MLDIYKYLEFLWPRRKTIGGLFLILSVILIPLHGFLIQADIKFETQGLIFSIVVFTGWIFWLFDSGRLSFPSEKIIIAFAINSSSSSSRHIINMTMAMVQERLKLSKTLESFYLREIGTDIITSRDQSYKFINKRKYNMIISGTVFSGKADGRYRYDLKNLKFTYRIFNPPKDSRLLKELKGDFDLFAQQRDWLIEESNDIIDAEKVSDNLVEIILEIIAQCLSRNIDTIPFSIRVLEIILPEIEQKAQREGKTVKIDTTKKKISLHFDNLRSGRVRNLLGKLYLLYSEILIDNEDYSASIEQAEKGLKVGANPFNSHALLALSSFYHGNVKKSESHVDEMGKIDSKHPLYLVDKAFFYIRHKLYNNVVDLYRRLPDMNEQYEYIIFKTISFLFEQLKEQPTEIAYKFAIGYLNYHHGDKKEGLQMLRRFKKEYQNKTQYKDMYKVASDLS